MCEESRFDSKSMLDYLADQPEADEDLPLVPFNPGNRDYSQEQGELALWEGVNSLAKQLTTILEGAKGMGERIREQNGSCNLCGGILDIEGQCINDFCRRYLTPRVPKPTKERLEEISGVVLSEGHYFTYGVTMEGSAESGPWGINYEGYRWGQVYLQHRVGSDQVHLFINPKAPGFTPMHSLGWDLPVVQNFILKCAGEGS